MDRVTFSKPSLPSIDSTPPTPQLDLQESILAVAATLKTDRHRVPLLLRLKAWWDGSDVVVHARRSGTGDAAPTRQVIGEPDPNRPWETPRVLLAQMLWGAGFSHPGGADEAIKLANPFALDPAMTVLELGAGLGGGARAVVEQFGVWVNGHESDREFATAGMQLSTQAGLAKKAEIKLSLPDEPEIRPNSVDCIMCRELLHKVADKPRLVRAMEQALKPKGQLVMTDFMLSETGRADSPAVEAWRQSLGADAELWPLDRYTLALGAEKMDVRVTEDITAPYRSLVLRGWADLTRAIGGVSLDQRLAQCMVDELERWMRLVAAIDSGDLKLFRIYALKPGSKTLSDW